jgi:radical SAM superfamily enzyme
MAPTRHGSAVSEDRRVSAQSAKQFQLILVKPSHYDDDGYVIQWARSAVPSNTMATIYGLVLDSMERRVLGDNVTINVTALDETNTHVRVDDLAEMVKRSGGLGMVALVGVQTNQFPRAVDLARRFIAKGVQACIGGFHVSGSLAMLPETPAEIQAAMDDGISLFAGELEGRLDQLLQDACAGQLEPLYNFMDDLPGLESQPVPYLPADLIHRMSSSRTSFDAGRGCPFLCSFCTIINVQGRKSRYRSADDVERIVRSNVEQGIHKFFITDDNFARNKVWELMFDRLIKLREEDGIDLKLTIQVDTMCHKIRNFIEKAGRAGVEKVFIGLESINPDSLNGSRKTQNNITEYRRMLQAWHAAGAVTCAGYILGFPTDTRESILRDIKIIQRELPVDCLEFFILIPLPGSQDHKELWEQGIAMDSDMNNYDSVHVTTAHAKMSDAEWVGIYHEAWEAYYSPEHVETVMRRASQWGNLVDKVKWVMFSFHSTARIEHLHPLDGGLLRRKVRTDRRSGLPLENPIVFYPRYAWEILSKSARLVAMYLSYQRRYKRVMAGRSVAQALNAAMQPAEESEMDSLELFSATEAARSVVVKMKKKAERKRQRPPARGKTKQVSAAPVD